MRTDMATFRGAFFVAASALLPMMLVGCASTEPRMSSGEAMPAASYVAMYGERGDERFPLPATDISQVDPKFLRQEVAYLRPDQPGTIVIDTGQKFLYLVRENGRALRYGIGVGKAGLAWSGVARVGRKAEWPRWTPTSDMVAREPERNGPWKGGMEPGLGNPLGPRALYLFDGDRDTFYRIHGTTEPETIGTSVSSGCIRLFDQDIIDLYGRVPVETRVIVLDPSQHVETPAAAAPPGASEFGPGTST